MTNPPILFNWDGECLTPARPSDARLCDEHYVVDGKLALVEYKGRSQRSHNHYFALIEEAWKNIPESQAMSPWAGSPEHLRKYALIRTGYHMVTTFACESKAEARRTRATLASVDDTAVVTTDERLVYRHVAASQSKQAMGADRFQKSKDDVLGFIAQLIGTTPTAIEAAAREAA